MNFYRKKGFTIVELVIVIAVIATLAAVLIPTFSSVIEKAKNAAAIHDARNAYMEYISQDDNYDDIKKSFIIEVKENLQYVVYLNGQLKETIYASKTEAENQIVGEYIFIKENKQSEGNNIGTGNTEQPTSPESSEYIFINSIEDIPSNADHSQKYVLPDNYVVKWQQQYVTKKYNANNENAKLNYMPNVQTAVDVDPANKVDGVLTSDKIPFNSDWASSSDRNLSIVNISGIDKIISRDYGGGIVSSIFVYYYKTDGSYIVVKRSVELNSLGNIPLSQEITLPTSFQIKDSNYGNTSFSEVGYVKIVIGVSTSSITEEDIKDVVINVPYYDTEELEWGWFKTDEVYSNGEIIEPEKSKVLYAIGDSITYGSQGSNPGTINGSWIKHVIELNEYDTDKSKNLGLVGIGFDTYAQNTELIVRDIVDKTQAAKDKFGFDYDLSEADIVTIAIGINDWKNYYSSVTDFFTELKYCVNKIKEQNPDCEIYYIMPFNMRVGTYEDNFALGFVGNSNPDNCYSYSLQTFKDMIANKFETDNEFKNLGVNIIDISPVTRDNINDILADGIHPNNTGYELIGKMLSTELNNETPIVEIYSITKNLDNCSISNMASTIYEGIPFNATITPNTGYELVSVQVIMGSTNVDATNGIISIQKVTGSITITATVQGISQSEPENEPKNFCIPNGDGWITGGRCSSTGADRTDVKKAIVTNYIEVQNGDVVYVKNLQISTQYASGVYKNNKSASDGFIMGEETVAINVVGSGDEIQFTINYDGVAYIRLCGEIGIDTSIESNSSLVNETINNIIINIERNGEMLTN